MAKGFDFIEHGEVVTNVPDAVPHAMHILFHVELDEGETGLSVGAFMFGMQGRRVAPTTAHNTLRHLAATGVVGYSYGGAIQYPPEV